MADAPELLTVDEAAPILRTTPKAVRHMLDRGALPAAVVLRLGRRVLLRRDALRAHLGLLPCTAPSDLPAEGR